MLFFLIVLITFINRKITIILEDLIILIKMNIFLNFLFIKNDNSFMIFIVFIIFMIIIIYSIY